jgi:hypothetical protein
MVPLLDGLGLAVWYMGDGTLSRQTPCFAVGRHIDLPPVVEALNRRFGLDFKETEYEREWQIRVGDISGFISLVGDHIIPSMKYKIPN